MREQVGIDLSSEPDRAVKGVWRSPEAYLEVQKNEMALCQLRNLVAGLEGLRNHCHGTFNGGHEDKACRQAFHHGMDTAFNFLVTRLDCQEKYKLAHLADLLEAARLLDWADRCGHHAACYDSLRDELRSKMRYAPQPEEE